MAAEVARQRALTTARLALAAIALPWQRASKALSNMILTEDHVFRFIHELSFREGGVASCGSRKPQARSGQRLDAAEWKQLQDNFADDFSIVGEALKSIVDISVQPVRPRTIHALTHALLWFYKGCREDEPVIAIVNFAAALDCLVSGEGREGIKSLVRAQLGVDADKALWARGNQTAEKAIEEIYDHARNAILHGRKDHLKGRPDSKPFHDWGPGRDRAEALAQYCLQACIDWAARHPESDDPGSWQRRDT